MPTRLPPPSPTYTPKHRKKGAILLLSLFVLNSSSSVSNIEKDGNPYFGHWMGVGRERVRHIKGRTPFFWGLS